MRARIVGAAVSGVDPRVMGIGPVPAVGRLLERSGLTLDAVDVIELNEAFAAQGLACLRELGLADDDPRVNPNGGAIALGQANRLPLGLASYAFTRGLGTADRLAAAIECGNIVLNHWVVSFPETPFGGVKDSGVGVEGGSEGFQAFEQVKFVSQTSE